MLPDWKTLAQPSRPLAPGLLLALGVAFAARALHGLVPGPRLDAAISEILLAVLLGVLVRYAIGPLARAQAGIHFALVRVLRVGIVLLGLRLSLQDVVATGGSALLLIVACIALALTLALGAGRLLGVPVRLATLIGVGTAICGNSAIVATAPVIDAGEDEVGFAVATITLFGLLAVVAYPMIGLALHLDERLFGLWAGVAVNDTSQVVATAAAYGPSALDVAAVVKLTRNTLMAPVIVLLGVLHRRRGAPAGGAAPTLGRLVPGFVLAFVAMSLLRTLGVAAGVLPQSVASPGALTAGAEVLRAADAASRFCILVALSAIGLGTDVSRLRAIGLKPLLLGLSVAGALAVASLGAVLAIGD